MTATVPPASAADEQRAGHRQGLFPHGKLHGLCITRRSLTRV